MGMQPLDWLDIAAWINLMNADLHPEEVKILRDLSNAFVSWTNKSKAQDCPAPYKEVDTPAIKSANIKAQMQRFRQSQKK